MENSVMSLSGVVEEAEKLLTDGSSRSRSLVAAAVGKMGDLPGMTAVQRGEWHKLVGLFARDRETVVRAVLAETVKRNPNMPVDVAERMARDVVEVARPILTHCEVLTDDFLIDLVEEGNTDKQDAIIGRRRISEALSQVIIDECEQGQVARLAANNGAELSERNLERILERFENAWPVVTGLAKRKTLPPSVAEKVVAKVSTRLKANLRDRGELARLSSAEPGAAAAPPQIAPAPAASVPVPPAPAGPAVAPPAPVPAPAPAAAPVRIVRSGMAAGTYRLAESSRALARQMHQQGKLKPVDALKALCTGDLPFFESALAARANMPLATVQSMLHDARVNGFHSINEKAKIPGTFLPTIRAAITAIAETPFDGMPGDRQRYVDVVIARILTQVDEMGADMLEFLGEQFAPAQDAAAA